MTTTENLKLKKPDGSDKVLIGDLNANADTLDAAIGKMSSLKTTEKGSLVSAVNEVNASATNANTAAAGTVKYSVAQSLTIPQKELAQVNIGVTWPCRPNLLDNWYFGNPVNQRGQTSWSNLNQSWMFTVDRWKCLKGNVTVADGAVTFTSNTETGYKRFLQKLEITMRAGTTYTLSVFCNVKSYSGTVSIALSNSSYTLLKTGDISKTGEQVLTATFKAKTDNVNICAEVIAYNSANDYIDVDLYAVKLELGSTQTLAHQDADGNWVLNEIPNYGEQLVRCQRYYQILEGKSDTVSNYFATGFANNTTDFWVNIPLSTPMRAIPTVSASDAALFKVGKLASSAVAATKVTGGWGIRAGSNCAMRSVYISTSGLTAGENYNLYLGNGARLEFSADL